MDTSQTRRTRRLLPVAVAGVAALLLAGCAGTTEAPSAKAPAAAAAAHGDAHAILDRLGLAETSVDRAIEALDQKAGERQRDVLASVRYDTLVLKDGNSETSVPIPGDRFYLSVAPYVSQTHECFYHSLTTCQGELADQTVQVKIADSAGKVLVDGPATTYSNGFVGFWLPKDMTGTITVTHEGRTATVPISTGKDAPTCLTTVRLA